MSQAAYGECIQLYQCGVSNGYALFVKNLAETGDTGDTEKYDKED